MEVLRVVYRGGFFQAGLIACGVILRMVIKFVSVWGRIYLHRLAVFNDVFRVPRTPTNAKSQSDSRLVKALSGYLWCGMHSFSRFLRAIFWLRTGIRFGGVSRLFPWRC